MNLESFVYVTGEPGLYEMVASRDNGLVLKSLDTGKAKFYSVRKHQFTPLGTVAIYTLEDSEPLKNVFATIKSKFEETPPVAVKSEKHIIQEYFEGILPNYDEDKVSVKDMKKVIKWFNILNERGLLEETEETTETDDKDETEKKGASEEE